MDQMDQSKSVQQANKLKTPIIAQLQIIIDKMKKLYIIMISIIK